MCRERCVYLLVVFVLSIQSPIFFEAWAHDVFAPEGRGRAGSTYQHWRFDTDVNPAGPEESGNPYGQALAAVTVGQFGDGWYDAVSFGSMTGVWDLGREGTIGLNISNVAASLEYMEVRIQVTYFDSITAAPAIVVQDGQFMSSQTVVLEEDVLGEWILYQGVWRVEPSQDRIVVTVTSAFNGSVIDQVVVDTASPGACFVDYGDIDAMHAQWLDSGEGLRADLNGSNRVDMVDFAILAEYWFDPCPTEW